MRSPLPVLLALVLLAPGALATHGADPLLALDACTVHVLDRPVSECGKLVLVADAGDHPGSDGNTWLILFAHACAPEAGCASTGDLAFTAGAEPRPSDDGNSWLIVFARGCAPGAGCFGTP
jgi:hypothetical protein